MPDLDALEIQHWPIDKLTDNPENYRFHPELQVEHLRESLRTFGWYKNVVITPDGVILAGHGIVTAAKEEGLQQVPVFVFTGNEDQARKLLIGDNEVWRLAEDDDRKLTDLLKSLHESDEGLAGTGFDEMMLANLAFVTRPEQEVANFDAAKEWIGMPEVEEQESDTGVALQVWFKTPELRQEFMEKNELVNRGGGKASRGSSLSSWWPPRERERLADYKFETEDEAAAGAAADEDAATPPETTTDEDTSSE